MGHSVQTQPVTPTQAGCNYLWSPTAGVPNPTDAEPLITPPVTTFYERRIICGTDTSYDYAMITVNAGLFIDWGYPDTLLVCQYQSPITLGFDVSDFQSPWGPPFLQGYAHQWSTGATADSIVVTQSGLYSLNMLAPDSSHCDAFAGEVYILFSPCTNLEPSENESISIFPNPAQDFIEIVSTEKISSVSLLDMTGKRLFFSEKTAKIAVSAFAIGIYLLEIQTLKGKVVKKVVVE